MNTRDSWGTFLPQVKWRTYYSNQVDIKAKPLPNNAKLVGTFTIEAKADKTEVNPSEPVNVTVEVQGDGNLEDIGSFKPYIKGVNVFAEKVEVQGNRLTQKLAFVSDKDFTIPAFSIAFYNLKTQRVEKISTNPISVKVTGSVQNEPTKLNIKRDDSQTGNVAVSGDIQTQQSGSVSYIWLFTAFILGTAFGIALMLFKPLEFLKKEKVFNLKDEKLLLIKLLPFRDKDEEVKKIVDILESNLYSGKKQSIDRKVLKEILKKYDIS
jgi:hypothetical protein